MSIMVSSDAKPKYDGSAIVHSAAHFAKGVGFTEIVVLDRSNGIDSGSSCRLRGPLHSLLVVTSAESATAAAKILNFLLSFCLF
jgi:hypothetical protein